MARANRARRYSRRRILKKGKTNSKSVMVKEFVSEFLGEIEIVANEILLKHDNIAVFFPDNESLRQLQVDYFIRKDKIRNFVRNHVCADDVDTLHNLNIGDKITVKNLNGVNLHIERNTENLLLNGMQLEYIMEQEKNGKMAYIYQLKGYILPKDSSMTTRKQQRKRLRKVLKEMKRVI